MPAFACAVAEIFVKAIAWSQSFAKKRLESLHAVRGICTVCVRVKDGSSLI